MAMNNSNFRELIESLKDLTPTQKGTYLAVQRWR